MSVEEASDEETRKRKAEDIEEISAEQERNNTREEESVVVETERDENQQQQQLSNENVEEIQEADFVNMDTAASAEENEQAATHKGMEKNVVSESPEDNSNNKRRNDYDALRWVIINNDGEPDSMIKLVGLKSLFSKQLPKMPRSYIARLVFDRRHTSLAILSDNPDVKDSDDEIIGGICYRAFPEMRFAEIAFCAVSANYQVKGYGTKLMNLFKYRAAQTGIEYFITYADNYAIGYFKKQGFTKSIQMPRGRYSGLIKEYDGGTPMECYVHPSIDFTRIKEMLDAQRTFILQHVKKHANSHTVYDPLPKEFSPNVEGVSRANLVAAQAMAIPGIIDAGWTLNDLIEATGVGKETDRQKGALKSELLALVRKIQEQQFAWPFREPVDTSAIPDYAEVIKEPVDLSTIEKRIRHDNHYKSKQMLLSDLILMVNNCKLYNDEESAYVQCATSLEAFIGTLFADCAAAAAAGKI